MPVNVKGMIADTFMQLSREKNVDKITVKDLVERCGISRQTFYYHFQDLLEVIEWSMAAGLSDPADTQPVLRRPGGGPPGLHLRLRRGGRAAAKAAAFSASGAD